MHCAAEHVSEMQLTVQQSVFAVHGWPADAHVVVFTVQAPVGSHIPEQHVAFDVHDVPYTPHGGGGLPLPPIPVSSPVPPFL